MFDFKNASLALAAIGTVFVGSALATSSMAAGRNDKGAWTIDHRVSPTKLAHHRTGRHQRNERVERHYDAARAREASKISGSVPGNSWATDNKEAAARRAVAGNRH